MSSKHERNGQRPGFTRKGSAPKKAMSKSFELLKVNETTTFSENLVRSQRRFNYLKPEGQVGWSGKENAGEADLIIGLDFGTTCTKAVVQEPDSKQAWAIPFSKNTSNRYLLPSRVEEKDGIYSLSDGEAIHSNLKLSVLADNAPESAYISVVCYLALVTRHICAWMEANKKDDLRGVSPHWSIHVGLPANNLKNQTLVEKYDNLLMAAASLALSPAKEITRKDAQRILSAVSNGHQSQYNLLHPDRLGIIPEITAQVYGYINSSAWDPARPQFMVVDVGGGTVDSSIFNVTRGSNGEHRFSFFESLVLYSGAEVLHRARLSWLSGQLEKAKSVGQNLAIKCKEMLEDSSQIDTVPARLSDYLHNAECIPDTIDREFQKEHMRPLPQMIIRVRGKNPLDRKPWENHTLLLSGGGRGIPVYREFIDSINTNPNFHINLQEIIMEMPDRLDASGLSRENYHRLSVAYGLSFRKDASCRDILNLDTSPPPTTSPQESAANWRYDR